MRSPERHNLQIAVKSQSVAIDENGEINNKKKWNCC